MYADICVGAGVKLQSEIIILTYAAHIFFAVRTHRAVHVYVLSTPLDNVQRYIFPTKVHFGTNHSLCIDPTQAISTHACHVDKHIGF